MYFIKPPVLLKILYPEALWNVPTNKNELFLTFDDGPIPEITPWVLEQLKQFNAFATFFCVGDNIYKHPEVFQALLNHGHAIGNHTFNHLNGWNTSKEDYLMNIDKCDTYTKSRFFRPPYGKLKLSQYKALKRSHKIIMWDVLSGDFDQNLSEEKCLKNVIQNTRNGSIIVFHDSLKAEQRLKYVLPKVLEYYGNKGYVFKTLLEA